MPYAQCRPGVEELRRVRSADLSRKHRPHLVVIDARVVFRIEVVVLPAPIRPTAGEPIEDLTRVTLRTEVLVTRNLGQRGLVGHRSAEPFRHVGLIDALGRLRYPRLTAVLLGEDIDRDLAPARRHHDVGASKITEPSGLTDPGRARFEGDACVGVVGRRVRALKLHGDAPCLSRVPLADLKLRRRRYEHLFVLSVHRVGPGHPLCRIRPGTTRYWGRNPQLLVRSLWVTGESGG